ncbi:glycosyltransferase family 90 protein [Dothidotthia symphoricarpi CBS 119687]|uniref:Glycosyltransferase family 90 protein n=1 Tax=Dothidotthia symphoricarpi CBS 119687 TaxID=1392245 RepID=A0A6A6A422_9PLEO|nr:glycosyltransferase family 90 protein [Dothidotthia symphoricarpi CBS 119687]KAF2125925.1 glycosyltransferase family 90 protein [Dothidotthia symphoricarpi CBS 119687]
MPMAGLETLVALLWGYAGGEWKGRSMEGEENERDCLRHGLADPESTSTPSTPNPATPIELRSTHATRLHAHRRALTFSSAPMHPAASLIVEKIVRYHQLFIPLPFSILATVANVHTPAQHSLLIATVSWALIWVPTIFLAGLWSHTGGKRRTQGWLAGVFLALSLICERATCDKQGVWATKGLLPLFAVLISEYEQFSKHITLPSYSPFDESAPSSSISPEPRSHHGSHQILAVLTVCASAVLALYTTAPTSVLGISSAMFAGTGLVLFGEAVTGARDDIAGGNRGLVSANGTLSRRSSVSGSRNEQRVAALRDVAAAMTIACGVAAFLMEPTRTHVSWKPVHYYHTLQRVLWMILANVVVNVLIFLILSQQGAVHVSLLTLFSYLCAKLVFATSFSGVWFTIIYGSSALIYLSGSSSTSFVDIRSSIRFRRMMVGITLLSTTLLLLRNASGMHHEIPPRITSPFTVIPPATPLQPMSLNMSLGHPAAQLINAAEDKFERMLNRQSKSLADAVREYRRRHGVAPPPHFDKWYEFAVRNDVVMIDEYDTIVEMLVPFWAVAPATIRSRITKAIGHDDSALIGVAIRDGEIVKIENGQDWEQRAAAGMMEKFVQYLPDMDLGFNIHDEPRVVVPNDLLSAMIAKARDEVLPRATKNKTPRNAFSGRPAEMNDGKRFTEMSTSKFNRFAHQQTWTHSRFSCPSDSQAQTFEDYAADNLTMYAAGPLNYIYNSTAFSDICNSPSLSSTFGFFERPNAFSITHELTPIFSSSKISSFQDILYPSPWYWNGNVGYNEERDTAWENKTNSLYWRGSTTGGFSRNGGWRRQHRQHIVRRLNAPDKAQILTPTHTDPTTYAVTNITRRALEHLIDVKFSHVGQCDPGDCDAQTEFFDVVERVDGQDAWFYKHLLDMDGNAFSGRFYSFLQSRSLTYKMAIFREWHAEWLQPWVHFVPLSLRGDEHLDLVRWFSGDGTGVGEGVVPKKNAKKADKGGNGVTEGERRARVIAERSTGWHDRALRKVDFEAWFFRLLLEYGRVVDDHREEIGYPGP